MALVLWHPPLQNFHFEMNAPGVEGGTVHFGLNVSAPRFGRVWTSCARSFQPPLYCLAYFQHRSPDGHVLLYSKLLPFPILTVFFPFLLPPAVFSRCALPLAIQLLLGKFCFLPSPFRISLTSKCQSLPCTPHAWTCKFVWMFSLPPHKLRQTGSCGEAG